MHIKLFKNYLMSKVDVYVSQLWGIQVFSVSLLSLSVLLSLIPPIASYNESILRKLLLEKET